jgi:hypothetical protein
MQIPEADLADILEAPLVFMVGLADDQIHAPHEKVEMPLLLRARSRPRTAGTSSP